MVWVYAISSVVRNYIYVGMTKDVDARLARHNKGREKITKPYAPFQLIYTEVCANRVKAREREKYWKSGIGKQKLRDIRDQIILCLGGGTGRRAGFKIQFFRECGFDSHLEYTKKPLHFSKGFFVLIKTSIIFLRKSSCRFNLRLKLNSQIKFYY